MNITKKLKLVYDVIKANPGVQNDNAKLVAAVWRYENWNDNDSLEDNIRRVTRGETITRRCRDLHSMGLIKYSTESDNERMEAFKSERDNASTAFNQMFGADPIEEFDQLIKSIKPEDHHAISWLNDEE